MRNTASIGSTLGVLAAANVLAHRLLPGASAVVAAGKVALLAVIARSAGLTARELGLDRTDLRAGMRWGAAAAAVVATGYGVAVAVPVIRAAIPGSPVPWSRATVRAFVVIPVTTVLPEEFAFRGVLTALLTRRFGPGPALLGSSALFGLWHVLPGLAGGGPANEAVDQVVGSGRRAAVLRVGGTVLVTTVGGLSMGVARSRSGSLLAPVLFHWAVNGLGELIAARLVGRARSGLPSQPPVRRP